MRPSPRVLQVVLQLDPGGTERLVVDTVLRLHQRFPMAVCCLDEPGLWASRLTSIGVEVVALRRRPGFRPGLARAIAGVARRHGSTVFHCHHYSPFVYGRLASLLVPGSRIVFSEHGRLSDAPPSPKRRLATSLLTAGVKHLYAVSHDLRRHLLEEGFPDRLAVVWNGIDARTAPTPAERESARATLGVGSDARVVGSVGRLDPVKDFGTLVRAFAIARLRDPRLVLVIVGDGPERARLTDAIAAAGVADAVRLLGHREDVAALLPGFDVYANSSITEGISLTILEAMAAERPAVVTAVGGNPEVVEDGVTGLLRPARDVPGFAHAIEELSSNGEWAARLGAAGRRRVLEHFTLDRMVDRYAAIYESA
jgi:glycosyltransferase involved in cell wall biosynthesis